MCPVNPVANWEKGLLTSRNKGFFKKTTQMTLSNIIMLPNWGTLKNKSFDRLTYSKNIM